MFEPKNLFPMIAVAFAVAAAFRLTRGGARADPASRTWLLLALIFGGVSAWLWFRG